MRTTGIFTSHHYQIPFNNYNEPTYLIPFGDVHKFSPMHSCSKWKELLTWAKTKKRCYFLGMGDYLDMGSTTERRILGNPDLHDSTVKTLEQLYAYQINKFVKDIDFMKGKLVGIMGGNHYGQFQSGITSDHEIARLMGVKYLGVNTFIRLVFSYTKGGGKHAIDIFAHHGRGGGRTQGASLNPVHQMANTAEADIYLMGDNHQKQVSHISKLRLSANKNGDPVVIDRKILLARTGSFLKGYEDGQPSYVTDAGLPPSDLGVIKIELTPKRKHIPDDDGGRIDDRYIDIHASI